MYVQLGWNHSDYHTGSIYDSGALERPYSVAAKESKAVDWKVSETLCHGSAEENIMAIETGQEPA